MNAPQILRALDMQVGRNTVYRWIRQWKAEQEAQAAQKLCPNSKEAA
jgi:transposase